MHKYLDKLTKKERLLKLIELDMRRGISQKYSKEIQKISS
jgi:hypothetical protein